MLVTCSYCNRFHKRGEKCPNKPKPGTRQKEETYITRFRSSRAWRNKRAEIRARDLQLCQWCLKNGKYTFDRLEVHHIRPISKAWHKRLDSSNLITLCVNCHKLGETGDIPRKAFLEIVEKTRMRLNAF